LVDARTDTVGIVTGVTPRGFYLQDREGDGLPQTSDGIYVFTYDAPSIEVGDCVAVFDAMVQEYYGKTELSHVGRIELSDACDGSDIAPIQLPFGRLGMEYEDEYEQYEGMLVELDGLDAIVHGPTERYSSGEVEIAVLPAILQPAVKYGRIMRESDTLVDNGGPDETSLLHVSNLVGARLPNARFGDRLYSGDDGTQPLRAVLDYNYGKYQFMLLPDERVTVRPVSRFPDNVIEPSADEFTICTYNVHGLGTGMEQLPDREEYLQALSRQAEVIAESLHGCTVVALQETGTPVDAAALAQRLEQEHQLPYEAVALMGPGSHSAEFPLTDSFLVRSDRVDVLDSFTSQGCTDRDYGVLVLDSELCPDEQFPLFNRPPLVMDIEVTGEWEGAYSLRLVNNHWKSKAGDEDVNEIRRMMQAKHVADLSDEWLAEEAGRHIVVLGDLNDFLASAPISLLEHGADYPLVNTWTYLPDSDRYSFIFNGVSQILDHVLISPSMVDSLSIVDVAHQNADFAECATVGRSEQCQASDHDALMVSIRPGGAASAGGDLGYPGMAVTLVEADSGNRLSAITGVDGEYRIWDINPGEVQIQYAAPEWMTATPQQTTLTLNAGYNQIEPPEMHLDAVITAAEAVSSLIDATITKR